MTLCFCLIYKAITFMKKVILLSIIILLFGFLIPQKAHSAYSDYWNRPSYRYNNYWYRPSPSYNFRLGNYFNPYRVYAGNTPYRFGYNYPLNHFPSLNRICYGCGQVFGNPYQFGYPGPTSPFGYYSPYNRSSVSHFGSPGVVPFRSTTAPFGP